MTIVIHHNPDCGTSRNVLALIRASGIEPVVIDYRQAGWTRGQLLGLFAAADVTPQAALRIKGTDAEARGLTAAAVSDEAILAAMVEEPLLVNRPFVCAPKGVRLCRPSETVIGLLDRLPQGPVCKEDGTLLFDPGGSAG